MKIAMIGKGAWGRAVGCALQRNGHEVFFIERAHTQWPVEIQKPDFIFLALPCQVIRERLTALKIPKAPIVSLTKGIEIGTGLRATQILKEILPSHATAVVSGPSFAIEVEQQMPTAVVAAAQSEKLAQKTQEILHQKIFRVYRSKDVVGVELGGALKNVYAIAGGVCEGLRIGRNAMAGLLTRCLAEMVRIACDLGAKKETLYGLSGMGDLMLTAYSGLSRNHQIGEYLGAGKNLSEALQKVQGVAEGIYTSQALYRVVQEKQIKAPVLTEVYRVLHENKSPMSALHDLLLRQVNEE
ncbi:MAG: NAD(P)H-dependent glycerol-3-phosphate dehydrogenase [Verrucomicrobiota bacterium]